MTSCAEYFQDECHIYYLVMLCIYRFLIISNMPYLDLHVGTRRASKALCVEHVIHRFKVFASRGMPMRLSSARVWKDRLGFSLGW